MLLSMVDVPYLFLYFWNFLGIICPISPLSDSFPVGEGEGDQVDRRRPRGGPRRGYRNRGYRQRRPPPRRDEGPREEGGKDEGGKEEVRGGGMGWSEGRGEMGEG